LKTIKLHAIVRGRRIGLRSRLYAALSVTHSATAAAVYGLWRYISAFAQTFVTFAYLPHSSTYLCMPYRKSFVRRKTQVSNRRRLS